jgi:aryl-alcohol dehydrogenase-like predicted oxidoreductase
MEVHMERAPLGSTGWNASRIGLGTMALAIAGRCSESDAVRLIHRALDAGINWLDTADAYCLDDAETGYGERLVARALRDWTGGDADAVMVTTKGGCLRPKGAWTQNGEPARLKRACERSLKALGVDSIFLYTLHAPDPKTPFIDSVGALADLQREGKIRHVGLSNVDVGHIKEAQSVCAIAAVQNRHNLFDRDNVTNGVIEYCARRAISFVAHSAVGGHVGHVRAGESAALGEVAARRGLTTHQVCLLWLLAKRPQVFAIPGARRIESLASNLAALEHALSADDMAALAAGFPPGRLSRTVAVRVRNEMRRIGRRLRHRVS